MKTYLASLTKFIFISLLIAGCAAQRPPGGGSEDKTAPEIIAMNIEDGTTLVPLKQTIDIYFSEMLNEMSVKKGITLFPLNTSDIIVKTGRKKLSIKAKTSWESDQFYTLIFDNSLTDLRNNSLAKSVSLSFSTGTDIPQGRIGGQLYGLKKKETGTILISPSKNTDSLFSNYSYFAQTDANGLFNFSHLPEDEYTILGFIDKDKSKKYDPKFDDIILGDVLRVAVDDSSLVTLNMTIIRGNFENPVLLNAKNMHAGETRITFSKNLSSENDIQNFSIQNASIDTIIFRENMCSIFHELSDSDSLFIRVPSLVDTLGLFTADSSFSIRRMDFTDSTYTLSWKKNILEVYPAPDADSLEALFQNKSDTLKLLLNKIYPGAYTLDSALTLKGTLIITFPEDKRFPDLVLDKEYRQAIQYTIEAEFGSVSGFSDALIGRTFLLINNKNHYVSKADETGNFTFEKVVSGMYTLHYYIDFNNNSKQDYGMLSPFTAPEIVKPVLEGIQVRSNWDTEVNIKKNEEDL